MKLNVKLRLFFFVGLVSCISGRDLSYASSYLKTQPNSLSFSNSIASADASESQAPASHDLQTPVKQGEPILASKAPVKEEPILASKTPVKEEPILASKTPVKEEPILASKTPLKEEPILASKTPVKEEPILASKAPVKEEPILASKAPGKEEPILASKAPLKEGQASLTSKVPISSTINVPKEKVNEDVESQDNPKDTISTLKGESKITSNPKIDGSQLPNDVISTLNPSPTTFIVKQTIIEKGSKIMNEHDQPTTSQIDKQTTSEIDKKTTSENNIQITNENGNTTPLKSLTNGESIAIENSNVEEETDVKTSNVVKETVVKNSKEEETVVKNSKEEETVVKNSNVEEETVTKETIPPNIDLIKPSAPSVSTNKSTEDFTVGRAKEYEYYSELGINKDDFDLDLDSNNEAMLTDEDLQEEMKTSVRIGTQKIDSRPVSNKTGQFEDDEDSHFFAYILTFMVIAIVFYLLFHNKKRIIALIIEGRAGQSKRRFSRAKYHKLDNNLEEAITATKSSSSYIY